MASTFSFGFGGDDIETDGITTDIKDVERIISTAQTSSPLAARSHDLQELFLALPSSLAYSFLAVSLSDKQSTRGETAQDGSSDSSRREKVRRIPRRAVFDVRTQLMAESSPDENNNDDLISGLDTGDLTSGVYEGGFKTWECAVDLAAFISGQISFAADENWHIIELGAGSAIPCLSVLQEALSRTRTGNGQLRFTFSDYNEEVLRLVTLPNVLLTWWESRINRDSTSSSKAVNEEADLDEIDGEMTRSFVVECQDQGISLDFVSGAWGSEFLHIVTSQSGPTKDVLKSKENMIILASETIYSPSSLYAFSQTVLDLLKGAKGSAKAFVAAKQIYFGVGGGVREFMQEMQNTGVSIKEVASITDGGVGRVILEVSLL